MLKNGQQLWSRQHVTIPANGTLTVDTGIAQVSKAMNPSLPTCIQVIPLPQYVYWAGITHSAPTLVNGTYQVTFTNGGAEVSVNVLFVDMHSVAGPGEVL